MSKNRTIRLSIVVACLVAVVAIILLTQNGTLPEGGKTMSNSNKKTEIPKNTHQGEGIADSGGGKEAVDAGSPANETASVPKDPIPLGMPASTEEFQDMKENARKADPE